MNYKFWLVLAAGVCQCQVTTQCSATCGDSGCDDQTDNCYACQTGRYGAKCDQDCGACVEENCSSRACTLGCKAGYLQVFTEPELSYCQPCKTNCAVCSNSSFCTMCKEGFYLTEYINEHERGETQCMHCSTPLPFCTSCYFQQSMLVCNSCANGYALSQDECVVHSCRSITCLNSCDSSSICDGCVDGFMGPTCTYRCNNTCAKCSINSQDICEKCNNGFYSPTCLQPCNSNCLSINNPTCNFEDGKCSYGCNNGFWGDWCENKCSEICKDFAGGLSVCFRNGTCTLGYKDCFDVDNFTQKTSNTTLSSSVIENDKHIAIIGGLSAAVALLFVALIIHILRSRSKGLPFRSFCCSWQNTNDPTDAYTTLQIQQPSERNEYDVMESNLSVHTGPEPETVQSQSRVEYINTALGH